MQINEEPFQIQERDTNSVSNNNLPQANFNQTSAYDKSFNQQIDFFHQINKSQLSVEESLDSKNSQAFNGNSTLVDFKASQYRGKDKGLFKSMKTKYIKQVGEVFQVQFGNQKSKEKSSKQNLKHLKKNIAIKTTDAKIKQDFIVGQSGHG